ncbi:hypothetical protein YC2023_010267 [Brassica napus]
MMDYLSSPTEDNQERSALRAGFDILANIYSSLFLNLLGCIHGRRNIPTDIYPSECTDEPHFVGIYRRTRFVGIFRRPVFVGIHRGTPYVGIVRGTLSEAASDAASDAASERRVLRLTPIKPAAATLTQPHLVFQIDATLLSLSISISGRPRALSSPSPIQTSSSLISISHSHELSHLHLHLRRRPRALSSPSQTQTSNSLLSDAARALSSPPIWVSSIVEKKLIVMVFVLKHLGYGFVSDGDGLLMLLFITISSL